MSFFVFKKKYICGVCLLHLHPQLSHAHWAKGATQQSSPPFLLERGVSRRTYLFSYLLIQNRNRYEFILTCFPTHFSAYRMLLYVLNQSKFGDADMHQALILCP